MSVSKPWLLALTLASLLDAGCGREGRMREPVSEDAGSHVDPDGGTMTMTTDAGPPPEECVEPEIACGSECAVLATDRDHCGACGAACPAWARCAAPLCDAPPFASEIASHRGDWTQTIGVAPDGSVHVVYAYEESSGRSGIHVASRRTTEWSHRTLRDDFPTRMGFSDVFADADGTLHLCYFHNPDSATARVAYLRITETGFDEEVLFEGGAYGASCALARASDGALSAAVIVRNPSGPSSDVFLTRRAPSGAWERSTIATPAADALSVDLALASDGSAHVVYATQLGHLDLELRYATRDGAGAWHDERIDRGASMHDAEIVLHEGAPLVAYIRDQGIEGSIATQINLAVRSGDGVWSLERITDERLGFEVALQLDARGIPHLAYAERSSGDSYRPVLAIVRDAGVQRFVLEEDFYMRSWDLRLSFAPTGAPHLSYFAYYPSEQVRVLSP